MVRGMHSKHTIRSETAKLTRKSWTDVLWPRRRKFEITATTIPLPRSPMIRINPVETMVLWLYFFFLPVASASRERARWNEFLVLISYEKGQDGPSLPARDFPRWSRKKKFSFWPNNSFFIRTKLVSSDGGILARFIFAFYECRLCLGP